MTGTTKAVWAAALCAVLLGAAPAAARKRVDSIVPNGATGGGPAPIAGLVSGPDLAAASGPVTGTLDAGDRTLPSGEYADVLPFTGRRGQHVVFRMVSDDFDTYLIVRNPSGSQQDNDDGGKGSNARIELTLPEDGVYQVVLTSARPGQTGAYTLELRVDGGRLGPITGAGPRVMPAPGVITLGGGRTQVVAGVHPISQGHISIRPGQGVISVGPGENPEPPVVPQINNPPATAPETLPEGAAVTSGQTIHGALGPGDRSLGGGQWADWYQFDAQAGQPVTIDLSAQSLDAYLAVVPPGGGDPLVNDDRAQGNTNSFLSFTAPATGRYLVAATSYQRGERGDYALRITVGGAGSSTSSPTAAQPGATTHGTLAAGDDRLSTGEFIDWYPLQAQGGEQATIDLASSEFDAYLVLVAPSGQQFEDDDANNGTHDARISRRLDEAGAWQVGVTSYQPGETGAYDLRVDTGAAGSPPPSVAPSGAGTTLTAGRSVGGRLETGDATLATGEFADSYSFDGQAGQAVRIDMGSTAFDAYLIVQTPSGRQVENDDSGPNDHNASVQLTLPETGTYRVLCTSYQAGEHGAYDVALSTGEAPATGPGPTWGSVPDQDRQFYGVFVGISDYPGTANDLPLCREDAEKLAQTFKGNGLMDDAHIDLLTDSRATAANVRAAMRRMASRVGPNDVFVFFYSGHGSQTDPDPRAYPDELDGRQESIVLGNDLYTDTEMAQDLDNIHAGLAVIALDSCFSGGFARQIISAPNRVGFFSSAEDLTSNVAQEFQAGGYLSYFFQKAVEGYADLNGDGLVQIGELAHYLESQFEENVHNASSETEDGASGYQDLVVDRGGVRVDTLFFRTGGHTAGAAAPRAVNVILR